LLAKSKYKIYELEEININLSALISEGTASTREINGESNFYVEISLRSSEKIAI